MVLDLEWPLKQEDSLSLVDEQKEEKLFLPKNQWLSLKV
jgi:hypothetical protein